MQCTGVAHQFRMSPFRLAHMDSPAVVSPHCVGYRDEHWMPHVALVHTRVPLQSCSESWRFCRKDSSRLASPMLDKKPAPMHGKEHTKNRPARRVGQPLGAVGTTLSSQAPAPHLLFVSEGQVLLQDPQKLGLVFRLAQNLPLLVVHAVGSAAEHCTVQFPASSSREADVGWQASILLGIGISVIPSQVVQTHCSAHTHLQCAPWAREILS